MKRSLNNKKWPNFFIVGAARAGTTSLYNFLKNAEGIFMSPVKETGHFIPNDPRGYNDEKKYLCLFEGAKDEKVLGEATPGYLTSPETPELIKMKVPHAKILITIISPRIFFGSFMNSSKIMILTCFAPKVSKYRLICW